jgi:hypothetical protein
MRLPVRRLMCLCLAVVILSSVLSAPAAAARTHSGPEPASTTETLDALSHTTLSTVGVVLRCYTI